MMRSFGVLVDVAAIGTVVSFIYLYTSIERHSLSGRPRLSTLLVFLLSGGTCLAVARFQRWLDGSSRPPVGGRTAGSVGGPLHVDDGTDPVGAGEVSNSLVPSRAGRYTLAIAVFCIVARLEIFSQVAHQQQCATAGIESFLCVLLFIYEVYSSRRKYTFPSPSDPDDPWRTIFDDIHDWFSGRRVTLFITGLSILIISLGTFHSTSQMLRSTYVCFEPLDSRSWTLSLQAAALLLDTAITVQLWRILIWTRTMESRIHTLGQVLILAAASMIPLWMLSYVYDGSGRVNASFVPLFDFSILLDSLCLSVFTICAAVWTCETSPLLPPTATTILIGLWGSVTNAMRFGDWAHISRAPAVYPAWTIAFGTIMFMSFHGIRSVFFLRRSILSLILLGGALGLTIWISPRTLPDYPRHPISDLIFKANIEHDRWLKEATFSDTLRAATSLYQERRSGRVPPPNFDKWYEFAQGTVMIDTFEQIEKDLSPFWKVPPEVIRERVEAMVTVPGVHSITVKNGQVTYRDAGDVPKNKDLSDIRDMIGKFSKYLPDMTLTINLDPTPRILPTWEEAHGRGKRDAGADIARLISTRSPEAELDVRVYSDEPDRMIPSPGEYREMLVAACAPSSRSRNQPFWDFSELCYECIRRHSKHHFMTKWDKSMETCQQGDLKNMHELFLTKPSMPPIPKLMPLFSTSKTDAFRDILIPLPRLTLEGQDSDLKWEFSRRFDKLYWRGEVREEDGVGQITRGSQRYRLQHLLLNPSDRDKIITLQSGPKAGSKKKKEVEFTYQQVLAAEANEVAPLDIGMEGFSTCSGKHCEAIKQALGAKGEDGQEPLEHRYVLLIDGPTSAPEQLMRTIRSGSVPMVSTVFRSWYTERLQAYLHFVPVDLRFHALHTTYLYFTGTEDRAKLNGKDANMKGRSDDGEWIAREGAKWAEKAMGPRDMEAYLFRLLLEWGRLIDDQRGVIGFRSTEQGDFENIGWTSAAEQAKK